jgi:hypothetical protein
MSDTTIIPNAIITVGNRNVIESIRINRETVYIYKDIRGGDRAAAYFTNLLDAVALALGEAIFYLGTCKRASREKEFLTAAVRTLSHEERMAAAVGAYGF